jgi:hypothetical protein
MTSLSANGCELIPSSSSRRTACFRVSPGSQQGVPSNGSPAMRGDDAENRVVGLRCPAAFSLQHCQRAFNSDG